MSDATDQPKQRSLEAAADGNNGPVGAAPTAGLERRRRAGSVMTALTLPEIVAAVLALGLWFVLFGGGSLLGTEVYRLQLAKSIAWQLKVKPMLVCLCFWTTSNLGLLACLSSFLGAVGYRCRFTQALNADCEVHDATEDVKSLLVTSYLAAVMRGFGVYTLSLAGLLLVATDAVTAPDQVTYMRLAPLVSIVGFYSGFNPQTFAGLLGRVQKLLRTEAASAGTKTGEGLSNTA
ncbi:MAG: hypothetical protein ACKO3T_23990 [Planctomycetaceae bacterium]